MREASLAVMRKKLMVTVPSPPPLDLNCAGRLYVLCHECTSEDPPLQQIVPLLPVGRKVANSMLLPSHDKTRVPPSLACNYREFW